MLAGVALPKRVEDVPVLELLPNKLVEPVPVDVLGKPKNGLSFFSSAIVLGLSRIIFFAEEYGPTSSLAGRRQLVGERAHGGGENSRYAQAQFNMARLNNASNVVETLSDLARF